MIRVSKWDDTGGYPACTCLFMIIHGHSSGDKCYEIGVAARDCPKTTGIFVRAFTYPFSQVRA